MATKRTSSAVVLVEKEHHNDQLTRELSGKVAQLRSLSIEIGDELHHQNDVLLRDVDALTSRASVSMADTGNRLQRLVTAPGTFSGCFYLLLISVAICSTLWLLIKTR